MGLAGAALAIEPAELDNRVRELTAKFDMMQSRADKGIPADVLRRAQGVILLDRTKAGFLFAYEGGGGVALAREPLGRKMESGRILRCQRSQPGVPGGWRAGLLCRLLMTPDANRLLTEPNFKFGGEARGTAGDVSAGHEGKVDDAGPAGAGL